MAVIQSAPVPDIAVSAMEQPEEPRAHFKRQSGFTPDQARADAKEELNRADTSSPGSSPGSSQGNSRRYRKKYTRPAAAATSSKVATAPAAASAPATAAATAPAVHPVFTKMHSTATNPRPAPARIAPRPASTSRPAALPFIPKTAKATFLSADFPGSVFVQGAQGHGQARLGPRNARQTTEQAEHKGRRLAFDPRTGRVHDEDTGQVFELQPVS